MISHPVANPDINCSESQKNNGDSNNLQRMPQPIRERFLWLCPTNQDKNVSVNRAYLLNRLVPGLFLIGALNSASGRNCTD